MKPLAIVLGDGLLTLPDGWTKKDWRAFEVTVDTYLDMCNILKIEPKSISIEFEENKEK